MIGFGNDLKLFRCQPIAQANTDSLPISYSAGKQLLKLNQISNISSKGSALEYDVACIDVFNIIFFILL